MNGHHTLHLRAFNAHAVLPRILLAFSRRRLRIQALQFYDVFGDAPAELQIDVEADPATVAVLARQLSRVVEVESVRAEAVEDGVRTDTAQSAAA
ncbi:MAG: ACT domain-containing protein [Gammaproteobacteria bacterium]|nr:ACT domain-containing protein [Gammaproteobacteria bacterium]